MKGIGGVCRSEPDLTTAAGGRDWRNSGYPPGFTVDELRLYRKKRAPDDFHLKDHLHLESGEFKQIKSEYRRRFHDYYDPNTRSAFHYDLKDLSPTRPDKPGDHLDFVGDEDEDGADVDGMRRSHAVRPEYHESFIEFPIEQHDAVNYRRYKRQVDAMPRQDHQKDFGSFGQRHSENRAQYVQHELADRTLPIRRSTCLKLEGDFAPTTEQAEQFIKYLRNKRRSLLRRNTNLRVEGDMANKRTETRDQYVPLAIQPRPVLYKKLTNLRLEGDLDITTENHAQFVPYDANSADIRPPLVKRSTNLRLEGDLHMSPEYRHEFIEYPDSERSSPTLPRHNLRVDGFFDAVTESREKFIGHQIHPPIPFLRGHAFNRKLLLGDDKPVSRAEYREKFVPHNIERAAAFKRGENLHLQGELETLTENRHAYVEHQHQPQLPRCGMHQPTNLQLQGQFHMSPEYRNAYVDFYKTSDFSSPLRGRRAESSLRTEGAMEAYPEYRRAFVDYPRQRPCVRKPETHFSSEGEMDHMTEKRAQYIEYPGYRKPDALKREPELKLEGDFVCQPEYRKAYVNYLIRERVDHKHRPLDNLAGVAVPAPRRAFEVLNAAEATTTAATATSTTTTTSDTTALGEPRAAAKSLIPIASKSSTPTAAAATATTTAATTTSATEESAYSSSTSSRIPRRLPSISTLEAQLFGPKIDHPKTFRSNSSSRLASRSPSPLPSRASRTRSLSRSSKTTHHSKGCTSDYDAETHHDRTGSRFSKSVRVEDLAYTPVTSPIPTHKLYNYSYAPRRKREKPAQGASANEQIDRRTAFMVINDDDDDDNNNENAFTDRNYADTSFYKEQKWMSTWNSPS